MYFYFNRQVNVQINFQCFSNLLLALLNRNKACFLKKGDKRPYPIITFCLSYSAAGASDRSSPCLTSRIASAILAVKSFTARIASSFAGIT